MSLFPSFKLTRKTVLGLLSLLLFFIAWNREINFLYGIFSLVLGMITVSSLASRRAIQGVCATRSLPSSAFEGDEMEMNVHLENQGSTRYMIEVVDFFPAALPPLQTPMTFAAKLSGHTKKEYRFPMTCDRRGEYTVGPLTLKSSYPLGITLAQRLLPGTESSLIVYPEIFEIASLPFLSGNPMPMHGRETVSKAGGSEDFFGTREYRQGESLKYIHWPSTARHTTWIVKEFEYLASTEVTLILDLHKDADVGEGKKTTLEYAVKIAASISKYALERGHRIQLVGYGDRPYLIPAGNGVNHWAEILEALARVKGVGTTPYAQVIQQGADLIQDGGIAVLFFSGPDDSMEAYADSFGLLRAKRVTPLSIFMERESFIGEKNNLSVNAFIHTLTGEGVPLYFISRDTSLPGIFQ